MNTFKVAVLISGNGSNLQALIDNFQKEEDPVKITCVISNKKDAFGLERAKKANIDSFFVDHNEFESREMFDQKLMQILENYVPDLIVLAGFMRILSEVFIDKYIGKIINIHPSLLPKYPGLETHKKVLANKDSVHGVTIHYVDNTLDGGPICAQLEMVVETNNINELEDQIHKIEHEIYPMVVKKIAEGKIGFKNGKVIHR